MDVAALVSALVAGGLLGAAATVLVSYRELRLKRLLESTALFMSVTAIAHGYRSSGEGSVGLGEQVAAVHLVGLLGRRNKDLTAAATEFLTRYESGSFGADSDAGVALIAAAETARRELKGLSKNPATSA